MYKKEFKVQNYPYLHENKCPRVTIHAVKVRVKLVQNQPFLHYCASEKVQDLIELCVKSSKLTFIRAKVQVLMKQRVEKVQIYLLCTQKCPRFSRVACRKVPNYCFTSENVQNFIELQVKKSKFTFYTHENVHVLIKLRIKRSKFTFFARKKSPI